MLTRTRGTTSDVTVRLRVAATATVTLTNIDPEDAHALLAEMAGDELHAAIAESLEVTDFEVDEIEAVEPHERDYELENE